MKENGYLTLKANNLEVKKIKKKLLKFCISNIAITLTANPRNLLPQISNRNSSLLMKMFKHSQKCFPSFLENVYFSVCVCV